MFKMNKYILNRYKNKYNFEYIILNIYINKFDSFIS